jgi:Protein kinase domain
MHMYGAAAAASHATDSTVPLSVAAAALSLGIAAAVLADRQRDQERLLTDDTTNLRQVVSVWSNHALQGAVPHHGSTTGTTTRCESYAAAPPPSLKQPQPNVKQNTRQLLRTRQTLRKMEQDSSKERLADRYTINWAEPLGEGSFGVVYLGFDQRSGDAVAVKKISKRHTGAEALQQEIRALLHLRDSGGHPNICSLREHFSEDDGYYYLILDLVVGGELFDHLVAQGAYSEADAARLVREVASALAFLHGGTPGLIHGDLKPENLMLSSRNPSDAVIKLIDFGCAVIMNDSDWLLDSESATSTAAVTTTSAAAAATPAPPLLHGRTLAYSPPEILNQKLDKLDPSVDMWALVRASNLCRQAKYVLTRSSFELTHCMCGNFIVDTPFTLSV